MQVSTHDARNRSLIIIIATCTLVLAACGRQPSRLLRQGQLPIYDFPLYLTEGMAGNVWKIERNREKTLVASGLNDPRGVATDRFQNVYIAEYGAGRLLKIDGATKDGSYSVIKEDLLQPSVVAVDSFGDVFVAQDGASNVTRISDMKVFATYPNIPTALTFGVDDQPIVGFYGSNKVVWGWDEAHDATTEVIAPLNASIDGTGRVYIAQGDPADGKVYRYNQREPAAQKLVADGLYGPNGIAVDLVGNIFVVEQGAGRIVLVTFDGVTYNWISDVTDPQYLAFTQY